jgi:RNA polymerase sigma factor (sigma-70 family)
VATDAALLQSYARSGDPEAFRQLVERHAGMVYGTALRITANPHDAEDVAQECFLQLARNAAKAARAVPAWLHRAAHNRALNVVRDRATRARHEPRAVPRSKADGPTWQEVAVHVDAALDALSEDLRHPLVAHFLEGRTQAEVADELGVSQSTVSRRMEKGLSRLRRQLSDAGLSVPAAVLGATLARNAVQAAPPAVVSALGELGLAGAGAYAEVTAGAGGLGTAKLAAAAGGTALAFGLAVLTLAPQPGPPPPAAPAPPAAVAPVPQPIEVAEDPPVENVMREDGKVWIAGMENVNWGGSFFTRQDSQAACIVEVLRCAGLDADYADVMGLSACAFKLTMAPNLGVAEIHSEMGMDWEEIVRRVWGLEYGAVGIAFSDEKNPGWREQLMGVCRESIDRGLPLFYMNGEWNLIVGYYEDGGAFICKAYAGDEAGYQESPTPTGFVGDAWFACKFERAGEPADRRESAVWSLRKAVSLARMAPEDNGYRLFGFDAYDAWISAVEKNREGASLHGNAFSYSQLLTSREAAAHYLRAVAEEFGGEAGERLHTAADGYLAIYQRLWDGQSCVMWPWEENWTPENRAVEAQILRECLAEERRAVSEIEAALIALGRPAYRAADAIRPELRNLLNWGTGAYPAPGVTPEDQAEWARIFDAEGEERLAGFARMAERHGCTVAEYRGAVLWLNGEGRIDALFFPVDQRDLAGFRRFFDLARDTGSPLAYTIVRCPEIYDVLSHQPDWYIRHNNQFERRAPEARPPDAAVRDDLLSIAWDDVWPDVADQAALPFDLFVQQLADAAADHGCTQKTEDGFAVWRDADGKAAAIVAVCEDTNLERIRRLYRALDEKDCPLAWLFLRLTHWDAPVFDILSLSRNHYMAHRDRVGAWQ